MVNLKTINEVAIRWNKTKDPKDKDLWYKLIKEWNNGRTSTLSANNNTDSRRDLYKGDTRV